MSKPLNTSFRINCLQQAKRHKSATAAEEGIIIFQTKIKWGRGGWRNLLLIFDLDKYLSFKSG
jgi:hypothetical protein